MEFEKVKEIIVDSLSCDEDAVTLEFDIEIPDDKAAEIKTVQDIVDYIKENA